MNGNYNKDYDGHFFRNTVIENARSINSKTISTGTLTSGKTSNIIKVESKIEFNEDLIIIKDGKEFILNDLFDKIERIEKYLKYLDDGLLITTFDNDGNNISINY